MHDQALPRVLIVDDEQHNIHVLGQALKHLCRVLVATSGEQALQKLASPPYPDMLLLDIMMPGIDGFEVCRRLPPPVGPADIPVIFITAMDSEEDEARGFALGAVDFITKPIRPAIVRARVLTHLTLLARKREILKSGELLRATLESTREGILAVGSDGTITHANSHFFRFFNLSPQLWLPGGAQQLQAALTTLLVNDDPFPVKFGQGPQSTGTESDILRFRDGRILACYSVPLIQNGAVTGRVWNFSDITQQKLYEAQLLQARGEAEAANKAKGSFLATMSHEIRTPLNGVMGMAELLLELELPPKGEEYVRTIHRSGQALLTIINDVLDYSKIEADKLQLESIPFCLTHLLQDLSLLFQGFAGKKAIAFVQEIDPRLPEWIEGDPTRLRQILINLLSNAVKFTKKGRVTLAAALVTTPTRESRIRFEVRDTGLGISPEQFSRLFRSFEQASSAIARQHGGTGLGLALTRKLVHLMQGEIDVESTPDVGTLFRVMLPLRVCDPVADRTSLSQTIESGNSELPLPTGIRILVAEDDPINRAVIGGLLRGIDGVIDYAENGQEAVEMLQASPYDLVFMDCQMPVMDGFTACRTWRALEGERPIPIVALTAYAMPEDREKCLAAGMNDYLPKPVGRQGIQTVLGRWLANRGPTASEPGETERIHSPVLDREIFTHLGAELEEDFDQIIDLFLQWLPKRVRTIQEAQEQGDAATMAREAHTLLGSCRQIGALSLAHTAQAIETIGKKNHTEEAAAWIATLEQEREHLTDAIALALSEYERRRLP
ncbi:MAG: response regulator [Magnetococcales bacterium]|nr:response regulator [Magnetococcales bacterium]